MAAGVIPVLRPLLAAHLEDLQDKLQPGLLVLTWTSLNIDGYLHRFDQVGSGSRLQESMHIRMHHSP